MLSFTLLGQTVLSRDGAPLARFRSQKEAALLIYLAQTGAAHPRDVLADLLWESSSTSQSLTNLRTALTRLRKQVGDALHVTRKTVELTPGNRQQVDSVILLHTLAAMGDIDTAEKAAGLQTALAAYRGDFLAGFDLPDAPRFDEWSRVTREHIRRQVVAAYEKLGQYVLAAGDVDTGMAVAHRWLAIDALDEAAHTLLIRQLLAAGKVREAVAQHDDYVARLRAELGIAPSEMVTALMQKVKAARPQTTLGLSPATAVRHNLPPEHDQFFGRHNAQQEIHTRLDQPWCRLVTITGQGGVGKTRLATTVARSRRSQYRDGIWLVALANLDPNDDDLAEAIAVEIATALDQRLTGAATPVAQLLNHLRHKQMMLVLDNFEHLLAGVQIVIDIVDQCEEVQLLVTSREALRLRAEWTMALTGLSYPTSESDETKTDAVELFAARRAQQQRGAVSDDNLAAIRQICRLVAGLPLAIELAAALTRHTSARAVADSLGDGFDALTTSLRDVPERHRGLHVVFEMSWRTLSPALQQQLARLSVFRGGFTETAVQQVTAAGPQHLNALIDKSLLTYQAETERYLLHPVIRAYAAAKREPSDPTPHKHAHYYLALLAQHTAPLQKERPQESMRLLEPDIDNIRRAWQTGLAAKNAGLLKNAITSFSIYFQLRGLAREGEAIMHTTLDAAKGWGNDGISVATRAGLERARFQNRLGQYRLAMQTLQSTLTLATQAGDRWAEGMAHVWWGESLWRLGEYESATNKLNHALDIAQKLDAPLLIGWCHHQLGIVNAIQSVPGTALNHLEQASEVWQKINNTNKLSVTLNSIGLVYRDQGDFNAAKEAMEKALEICTAQDNRYLQAMLLSNLSSIYIEQKDHFGAQYYLQLGLELAIASGSLHSQSDIYINLGENYRSQGEDKLAFDNLERGLEMAERIGNRPSIAEGLCRLADLKRKQKDSLGAEKLYDRALQISRQDNLKYIECEVLIGLVELYEDTDSEKAKQYSFEASNAVKKIEHPQLTQRVEAAIRYLSLK